VQASADCVIILSSMQRVYAMRYRIRTRVWWCGAALALLVGLLGSAPSRAAVAVNVGVGFPYVGAVAPGVGYGGVSVGYGYGPAHRWHGGGWYGRGWYGGGWYGGGWYGPWGAPYVALQAPLYYPAPVYYGGASVAPSAVSAPPTRPDPIIYPRNGQNSQQTEYDRQECNRWATTQPSAVADASVFQRAVEACMDGRGYTMR
jgi:hypothetical protein